MKVSIVIINYYTCELVLKCIESILDKTSDIHYEIIVLDNASWDGCGKLMCNKYSDRISFIQLNENIGFGRANNIGIKISKGKYVLFLNPDTELINNAVKIMADFLDLNPEVGIVGGNLFDGELAPAYSYRRFFPSVFWEINHMLGNVPERICFGQNANFNRTGRCLDVSYITGADIMIPKSVLEKVGMFDSRYFLFFEETDLAHTIRENGYKIVSNPFAHIKHFEGKSFELSSSRIENYISGREKYYRKNTGFLIHRIADAIFFSSILARIIVYSISDTTDDKLNYWKTLRVSYLKRKKG